jgi:hypothetical protein
MTLYGNPCMYPDLTFDTNHHKAGIFFSTEFGYSKWDNNNMCVSSYDIIKNPQSQIRVSNQKYQNDLSMAKNEIAEI